MPSPWHTLAQGCAESAEVVIAAPYIKLDTLNLVLNLADTGTRLVCVTRWTPKDIQAGVSDTACRTLVIERGGSFRLHTRLHAKYYRFGDCVLIGSANLTRAGLGYSGVGNLEILCEPGPQFDSKAFERQLLEESREVSDAEFACWNAIDVADSPHAMPAEGPFNAEGNSWKPLTRAPEHLWMTYDGQAGGIASDDERGLALVDLESLLVPEGLSREVFNNWVAAHLLASPFVESVIELEEQEDHVAWSHLAELWDMSESEAARCLETAHNWLGAFLAPELLPRGSQRGDGGSQTTVVGRK